jgi:hypothetical protein
MVKRVPVAVCLVAAVATATATSATGFTGCHACNDSVASAGAVFGTQIVVSTAASEASSVAVGDFNGDGHLDLASASYGDNKIAWYPNTDGQGTFGAQMMVSASATSKTTRVAVGDFNGDGHLDIASASPGDHKIAWYKNTDGLGKFGAEIVVSTTANNAASVAVGDFNGDGHLDLASACSNNIAWYKNTDGLGTFGTGIVVFTLPVRLSTTAVYASSVAVGDFNGDGHLDLASASVDDNKIAWYQNIDGLGTFGTQIVVSTAARWAFSVAVGDFNGDGYLDLASASFWDSKIAWYRNTDGLGTFGPQIVVSTAAKNAQRVAVGDFNGDGHLDLTSASKWDNKIAWYKNLGHGCPPGSNTINGTTCSCCASGSCSDETNRSNTCDPGLAGRATDQLAPTDQIAAPLLPLFTWAKEHGAYIHPCLEYRNAGMYTTCRIPPNTNLTHIPQNLILTKPGSTYLDLANLADRILAMTPNHRLWPYVSSLPKTCQIPACRAVNVTEVSMLGAKRIHTEMHHKPFFKWSTAKQAVWSVIQSRTWPRGMVPIIDLFNHDSHKGKKANLTDQGATLMSGSFTYEKGDQVFDDYGLTGRWHAYKHYGYIPDDVPPTCEDLRLLRIATHSKLRAQCISNSSSTLKAMAEELATAQAIGDLVMMKGAAQWIDQNIVWT